MSRRRRRRRHRSGGAPFSLFSFQDIMAAVTGVMIVTTLLLVIDLLTRTVATVAVAMPVDVPASADTAPNTASRQAELLALLEAEASAQVVSPAQLSALKREEALQREQIMALKQAKRETENLAQRELRRAERSQAEADALAEEWVQTQERIEVARRRPPVTLLAGNASGRPTWWVRLGSGPVTAGELHAAADAPEAADEQAWPTLAAFLREALAISPEERSWVLLVEADGVAAFSQAQEALRRAGFAVGWDLAPGATDEKP